MGYIYVIKNSQNKMCYVGQTIRSVKIRWTEHCATGKNRLLNKAIETYGKDMFEFVEVKECLDEDLDSCETKYITKYNSIHPNGYNIALKNFFTTDMNSRGGSSIDGHSKQSAVVKKRYLENPKLCNLGEIPKGISYYSRIERGMMREGFSVRMKDIPHKKFLSVEKKNNLAYNLERAKEYLAQQVQRSSV